MEAYLRGELGSCSDDPMNGKKSDSFFYCNSCFIVQVRFPAINNVSSTLKTHKLSLSHFNVISKFFSRRSAIFLICST